MTTEEIWIRTNMTKYKASKYYQQDLIEEKKRKNAIANLKAMQKQLKENKEANKLDTNKVITVGSITVSI